MRLRHLHEHWDASQWTPLQDCGVCDAGSVPGIGGRRTPCTSCEGTGHTSFVWGNSLLGDYGLRVIAKVSQHGRGVEPVVGSWFWYLTVSDNRAYAHLDERFGLSRGNGSLPECLRAAEEAMTTGAGPKFIEHFSGQESERSRRLRGI